MLPLVVGVAELLHDPNAAVDELYRAAVVGADFGISL